MSVGGFSWLKCLYFLFVFQIPLILCILFYPRHGISACDDSDAADSLSLRIWFVKYYTDFMVLPLGEPSDGYVTVPLHHHNTRTRTRLFGWTCSHVRVGRLLGSLHRNRGLRVLCKALLPEPRAHLQETRESGIVRFTSTLSKRPFVQFEMVLAPTLSNLLIHSPGTELYVLEACEETHSYPSSVVKEFNRRCLDNINPAIGKDRSLALAAGHNKKTNSQVCLW